MECGFAWASLLLPPGYQVIGSVAVGVGVGSCMHQFLSAARSKSQQKPVQSGLWLYYIRTVDSYFFIDGFSFRDYGTPTTAGGLLVGLSEMRLRGVDVLGGWRS